MDEARIFSAADLKVGLKAEFEREVGVEDVAAFASLSGDHNPLHMDEAYAAQTNYGERIVHGAFQVGLASTMAGMYLPGKTVVVGSFQCRFPAPLSYPSRVRVQGEITAWAPEAVNGTLRVRVSKLPHATLTAEIHVGFSLHEKRGQTEKAAIQAPRQDNRPVVVVTGASGGLGRKLVASLAEKYCVIGIVRTPASELAGTDAEWVEADMSGDEWEGLLQRQLGGRKIHGFIHCAWPGAPQGSLLDVEPQVLAHQLQFGTLVTIRIGRFLRVHGGESARFVVLGTVYATLSPVLNLSSYSLGKAALEHTVRLLAPELALKNMTINLVTPSFLPLGMNHAATNRILLSETAKVPIGRLCSAEDVAGSVEFLLSPGAAFISGQTLPLTGGKL
jgi:3-oxoacyl-[acyl-carrier protein] reductase